MNKSFQIAHCAALLALLAATTLPCSAADTAVLRNGFSIRHERRQVIGTITRLYVDGNDSDFVDVPTEEIDHFEALPLEPEKNEPAFQLQLQPTAQSAQHPPDLNEVVRAASGTYRLDPDLVNSV